MPSRKRSQEAKRAQRAAVRTTRRSNRRKKAKKRSGPSTSTPRRPPDPSDVPGAELRFVQPYEATKPYLCPGCNGTIPPGLGHMVVVPPEDPDLRRHWHRGCWNNRHSRY